MNRQENIVAWVGLDWADEGHQICEYDVQTGRTLFCWAEFIMAGDGSRRTQRSPTMTQQFNEK